MRSNTRDAARRAFLGLVRGTVHQPDDKPLMQTIDARLLHGELLTGIERFQPAYGFSSVPLPPDQQGSKAAEIIVGFINGNRSHPVVIAVDDRRHRPQNWQPGESGLYDDQKQQIRVARGGIAISGGDGNKPFTVTVGDATLTIADGKITAKVNKTAVQVTDGLVYLGGDPADGGSFDFVETASGPSSVVKAKL